MLVSAPIAKYEPQETGHWYTRAGEPAYQVKSASGSMRGTTLADAKKLCLCPSVTTVLSVLAKPALEQWKVKQGIMAALTLTRNAGESDSEYLARVLADSRQQAISAAEEGSRIHDACECAVKGLPYPDQYIPHVAGAIAKLNELFPGVNDWIAEASFASPLGFGGKVDLHSPSTGIIADYKTTDERRGSTKRFHWDQHYQLAAYQGGMGLQANVGVNIFISRTDPGVSFSHVWRVEEMNSGWRIFLHALELWKQLKGFDSSFIPEVIAA